MATISPYNNGIINYDYKPFQANLELEGRVLLHKQQEFDKAYAGLQKLKKQALNISFINDSQQQKIDGFNKKINSDFIGLNSGNFDLSQMDVVSRYMNTFNEIASDSQLLSNYRKDKQIQKEYQSFLKMKNSKDPIKAGYHPINEYVFSLGLQKYKGLAGEEISGHKFDGYTPYTDTDKEMAAKAKGIAVSKFNDYVRNEKGEMVKLTYQGRNEGQVLAAAQDYFGGRGQGQTKVEAAYYYHSNLKGNDVAKQRVKADYVGLLNTRKSDLEATAAQMDTLISTSKDPNAVAEYQQQRNRLTESINSISNKIGTVNDFDLDQDDDANISWLSDYYTYESARNAKETYGGYTISKQSVVDPVWKAYKDYEIKLGNLAIAKGGLELRAQGLQIDAAELLLKKQKAELEGKEAVGTTSTSGTPVIGGTTGGSVVNGVTGIKAGGITSTPTQYYGDERNAYSQTEIAKAMIPGIRRMAQDYTFLETNPWKFGVEGKFRSATETADTASNSLVEASNKLRDTKSYKRAIDNIDTDNKEALNKDIEELIAAETNHSNATHSRLKGSHFAKIQKLRDKLKQDYGLSESQYEDIEAYSKLGLLQQEVDKLKEGGAQEFINPTELARQYLLEEGKGVRDSEFLMRNPYFAAMDKVAKEYTKKNGNFSDILADEGDPNRYAAFDKLVKEELLPEATRLVDQDITSPFYNMKVGIKRNSRFYVHTVGDKTAEQILESQALVNRFVPLQYNLDTTGLSGKKKDPIVETRRQWSNSLENHIDGTKTLVNTEIEAGRNFGLGDLASPITILNGLISRQGEVLAIPEGSKPLSDIPQEAIKRVELMNGLVEMKIDVSKIPGYSSTKDANNNFYLTTKVTPKGDLQSFPLNESNNRIVYYDSSLSLDQEAITSTLPTKEWIEYRDYAHKTGRSYKLQTSDNINYTVALYDNQGYGTDQELGEFDTKQDLRYLTQYLDKMWAAKQGDSNDIKRALTLNMSR